MYPPFLRILTISLGALCLFGTTHGLAEPVLRIGYQKSSTLFLQKADGSLDKALAAEGIKVQWKEFTSGPPLIAALSGGSLDIGEVGDIPGIFAQAANAPVKYVAYLRASPHSVGILIPKKSTITSVAHLKGKKIAFAQGTNPHFLLAKALHNAGLSLADVTTVFLQPPEGRVAFESGTVDAWVIWDPFLAAAEIGGRGRLLIDGEGITPFYGFYLASNAWLDREGRKVLPTLFTQANALAERVAENHPSTAKLYATHMGLPLEVAETLERRKQRYGAYALTAEVIASQQEAADFFYEQGVIKKPIQIGDYVLKPQ